MVGNTRYKIHYPPMTDSRIPVSRSTRDLVKAQKRGGQTYDDLLREMVEQYDPDRNDPAISE